MIVKLLAFGPEVGLEVGLGMEMKPQSREMKV